ncbi:MAG TPA: aminoacyl-tRNA hydrolase [Thermodesulfobacteriota bacterium]|nr:aminoacyl-tRNA hydrolase [Thermodesulfobacteriota bacterium]
MKLVAGLGNPGKEYASTKHNLGFLAIDEIARRAGIDLTKKKFRGSYGEGFLSGEKLILLKPETYMNRSGEAVSEAAVFYNISPPDIIVIHDEMDLPSGTVRVKAGGGSAGHNGIRSIIDRLGSTEFIRVRMGIGKPGEKSRGASHVLSGFGSGESDTVKTSVERAADAVLELIEHGLERTMNKFNVRSAEN